MGNDHTIFAVRDGKVQFRYIKKGRQAIDVVEAGADS